MASYSPSTMALVLAAMDLAASVIGLLTYVAPQVPVPDRGFQVALTLTGVPSAALLLWLRRRFGEQLPPLLFHIWVVASVVVIGLGSWSARSDPTAVASTAFFVWIGLFVGHFFSTRQVAWHLGWIAVCLSVLLALNGNRATASVGIMMFGITVAATAATHYLSTLLRQVAVTDNLTGLPNRQTLDDILAREIARAGRNDAPLVVGVVDVDHFKDINDHHGHITGDEFLVDWVECWRSGLRRFDTMVRYGGDEFVVIMPGCTLDDARGRFDRLRHQAKLPSSIGVTALAPGESAGSLLQRADKALYRAKAAGRNQVATLAAPTGVLAGLEPTS